MITIRQPLSFSEIGRKDNQEDFLYPKDADKDTRVFIMCDGMGGHDNGEVASMTAATALGDSLREHAEVDAATFEEALSIAYDALDSIDTNSSKKPGTTMTCLCLNEDSYLMAHIGDSRIYHVRPSQYDAKSGRGGILYQSSDHSLVNDLIKAGELTEEEARDFPQRNVITRAMQPHLEKRYKADIYLLKDIEEGDYFFLCSDGVMEQLTNAKLCEILANPEFSDREKLDAIYDVCYDRTRDNYTCWLIPVDKVVLSADRKADRVICAEALHEQESLAVEKVADEKGGVAQGNVKKLKCPLCAVSQVPAKRLVTWLVMLVLVVALVWGSMYIYRAVFGAKAETEQSAVPKQKPKQKDRELERNVGPFVSQPQNTQMQEWQSDSTEQPQKKPESAKQENPVKQERIERDVKPVAEPKKGNEDKVKSMDKALQLL